MKENENCRQTLMTGVRNCNKLKKNESTGGIPVAGKSGL